MKQSFPLLTIFLSVFLTHMPSFAVVQNFNNKKQLPLDFDRQKYPELAKFAEKYRCAPEIEAMGKYADKRAFYLKGSEISRIINAERMNAVIEDNKLDKLAVPAKCLFKDQDRLVVASMAMQKKSIKERVITKAELQQLVALIEKTDIGDLIIGVDHNIALNEDGKFVFFDLEDLSFAQKRVMVPIVDLVQDAKLEKDALEWLQNYILFHPSWLDIFNFFGVQSLSQNTQYDEKIGVDFERVKKEFRDLNKERKINSSK